MFSDNLNRLMAAKGWRPAHLAAAMLDRGATIQEQSIQKWIDGVNEPRLRMLPAIAEALGCTYGDLLRVEPVGTSKSNAEQMLGKGHEVAAAGTVSTGTEG